MFITKEKNFFRPVTMRLSRFCREYFKDRSPAVPVICCECHAKVQLFGKNKDTTVLNSRPAINHAAVHLGHPLFKCEICDHGFGNRAIMMQHLKTMHNASHVSSKAHDIPSIYENDIIAMIKHCFGSKRKSPTAAGSPSASIR